jgi:hypothetical protein
MKQTGLKEKVKNNDTYKRDKYKKQAPANFSLSRDAGAKCVRQWYD